jgi:hypothetical protein
MEKQKMIARLIGILALIISLALLLTGCSSGKPTANEDAAGDSTEEAIVRTPSAPGATVFFISPVNGSTISSPAPIKFGISGMAVVPAGLFPDNSGHHHLLIDTELENFDQPIQSDAGHRHFGKGQTETTIELEPGLHTLQLVLGDGSHMPHNPPVMSEIITITVE